MVIVVCGAEYAAAASQHKVVYIAVILVKAAYICAVVIYFKRVHELVLL